jgi:hypothetical protein
MRQLLPLGIQDFVDIRERGFVYVDKTARIHEWLTGSGKPFFLSRPRRFGKSLLCSTLAAIFEGRRELFGEIAGRPALAINSLDWDWKKRPVIRIDLNAESYSVGGLDALYSILDVELQREARKHGVTLQPGNPTSQFKYLIEMACTNAGERVAVLIDEYDKPLLDTMSGDSTVYKNILGVLKGFYGVLKSYDEFLHFLLLTGITKFSKVSVFSELNHLDDLTLNPRYAGICGITQKELERNFGPEIEAILENTGKNREEYMGNLRNYYDGYRFSEKPLKVYNPFGLLHHFNQSGKFAPYWYETGTPTFLVRLITEQKINILNLTDMQVGPEEFRIFDAENMLAEPVLYQSGYLTITDYDDELDMYTLDFPNNEVRTSFAKSLIDHYLQPSNETAGRLNVKLLQAMAKGDIEETINALRRFLAAIPYDIIEKTENYYRTAIHLIFNILGLNCRSEVHTSNGRMDSLVELKNFVYCFEFKLDKTADEALAQIDTKEYLLPWTGSGKKLFKIGVNFDSEKRNIGEWKCVTAS